MISNTDANVYALEMKRRGASEQDLEKFKSCHVNSERLAGKMIKKEPSLAAVEKQFNAMFGGVK